MRDRDVRKVLRDRLIAAHEADQDVLLLEELGVCRGTARVDLAVIDGTLKGYEIKSERDTLARLADQASIYSQVFDTMTLVVAEKHLVAAESMIPSWWGIELAIPDGLSSVTLKTVREEAFNASVDAYALAQLLWREEALGIVEQLGTFRSLRTKPRKAVWQYLVIALPLSELKAAVRRSLKNRKGWQVAAPRMLNGEKFPPSSTSSSSPFRCARMRTLQYSRRPS